MNYETERTERIEVDTEKMMSYMYWQPFIVHLVMGMITGVWLLVWVVWVLGLGKWYVRKFAHTFEASLSPKRINIAEGVFTRKLKAIPLDRVTDVVQVQGVIMRSFDVWTISIQTAGSGATNIAEGTIIAPRDPGGMREKIIEARNKYVESVRSGGE